MTQKSSALAQAAEHLIGSPFRLRGRDPATGLDCFGLVIAALRDCGIEAHGFSGYAMRNSNIAPLLAVADTVGLVDADGSVQPGDVLLAQPGPAQFHLLVAAEGNRFIHAHAGLRRVVASPFPSPWPVLRHWRLS